MNKPATFIIYSKPGCGDCVRTLSIFISKKVEFTIVDVTEDPAAEAFVIGLGYRQLPVVVQAEDPNNHWSGMRLDKLVGL